MISIVAILSHQIYIFVFYPAIFGLFLYRIFVKQEKRQIVPALLNCGLPGLFGLYVQFFGKIKLPYEEYMELLKTRTNLPIVEAMVSGEYYISFAENTYIYGLLDQKIGFNRIYLELTVVLLVPFLVFLIEFWKEACTYHSKKVCKIIHIYLALLPTISILMFLTISDYGRVMTMLVFEEAFLILFLVKLDPRVYGQAFQNIYDRWKGKFGPYHTIIMCIYMLLFGFADNWRNLSEISQPIVETIRHWYQLMIA